MLSSRINTYKRFDGVPPFFERLIYYILAPEIFARVVLEGGMGIYWYSITQPKQWFFYACVCVEYFFFFRSILTAEFKKGVNIFVFILLALMTIHGVLVGALWGNSFSKIFTDTIPVLVLAINTLVLSTDKAYYRFSFDRVYSVTKVYSVVMVAVGFISVQIGLPSVVSLGGAAGTPLCLTILLIGIANSSNRSLRDFVLLVGVVVLIAPNMTRTSLLVFLLAFIFLLGRQVFRSGLTLYISVALALISVTAIPAVVPSDSPIMRRINNLFEEGSSTSEGSLGERRAELIAIRGKLKELGTEAQLFGSGAGGIYKVEFTNGNIPENYSHAHYGWALFELRYGLIGYLYLLAFGLLMVCNLIENARRRDPAARMVAVLGLWGTTFIFTYMFFNQLIAGLQFARPPRAVRSVESDPDEKLPTETDDTDVADTPSFAR